MRGAVRGACGAAMTFCWCLQYVGENGNVIHVLGKKGVRGDCKHYAVEPVDKDMVMRGHVRDSFVRVSNGLTDMAVQLALPLDPMPTAPRRKVASAVPVVHVTCTHSEDVVMLHHHFRELTRMVEELTEMELPDVDFSRYLRRIKEMKNGKSKSGS